MKIGIEAQRIFRRNKHGMDYVVLQEILQLQQIDHENEYYVFVKPGPDRCVEDSSNVHVVEVKTPTYPLWEQWALPRAVKKTGVELLHCTSNTAPLHCSVPLVLTLHDIIFLEPRGSASQSFYQNMGWHYRRCVVPRILERCKRIITVSQFELDNIVSKLGIPRERMAMIYNGYSEWFTPEEDREGITLRYIDQPDYIFFLGNTDPKKNTDRVLQAYAIYLERSSCRRKLLLADLEQRYLDQLLERLHLESLRSHIVIADYIPNRHLPFIYHSAFAFLYPSLRESFGIPILEAMACGTPVITGNTSAMPEIAGPDALLVDPTSPDAIADQILRLENDPTLREEKVKIGLERAQKFSWRRTATQLQSLYKDVCGDIDR